MTELHPWLHSPEHTHAFTDTDGKGGFWNFGPNYTADCIIISDESLPRIALIQRQDTGKLALPGGFIDTTEEPLGAAIREAREETALDISNVAGTLVYDGPVADYRATREAWPHTYAFRFVVPLANLLAGDDAKAASWVRFEDINPQQMHGSHHQLAAIALRGYK